MHWCLVSAPWLLVGCRRWLVRCRRWLIGLRRGLEGPSAAVLSFESAGSRSHNSESVMLHSDFIYMLTGIGNGSLLNIIGANGFTKMIVRKLLSAEEFMKY